MKEHNIKQGVLFEEYSESKEVQLKSDLANPWALDSNGNPILPENAERHGNYTCPKCHEPLNVRKRGIGEHSRRDHFYHKADTTCKGFTPRETESYIHKTAKEGVYKILQEHLNNSKPFPITWTCPTCGQLFTGNLLHNAKFVKIEKQYEDKTDEQSYRRPDVSLADKNDKLLVAIEVIKTNIINYKKWEFYNSNNIVVVSLIFKTFEDLNNIRQKLQNPDSVNVCFNITCKECLTMHLSRFILPLKKEQSKYTALSVAIKNPFDDSLYYGLPFSEQDMQNAELFIKNEWQHSPIKLEKSVKNGKHFLIVRFQQQKSVQLPRDSRSLPRRNHLTIDEMEASHLYGISKSRGYYNKSKSKNKSKSSSTIGKRGTGTNISRGKRRK